MILRFCICIPYFDHEKTIQNVVERCLQATKFPIIVIDDGSKVRASQLIPPNERVSIIRRSTNGGKGVALKTGLSFCLERGMTHMISIDADGQHHPEDIESLVALAIKKPMNLIVGVRKMPRKETPFLSRFGRGFSNFWIWVEAGIWTRDSQSGFRVYPLYQTQSLRSDSNHYDFEVEIMTRLFWAGTALSEGQIWVGGYGSKERVSHFYFIRDNFRISLLNSKLIVLSWFKRPAAAFRKPREWDGKMRGGSVGQAILAKLAEKTSLGFVHWICRLFIVPYFYLFSKSSRRASDQHWELLIGTEGFWSRQRRIFLHLRKFAEVLVDRFFQSQSSKPLFKVSDRGSNMMAAIHNQDRGCVILSAHVGSLDLLANCIEEKHGFQKEMVKNEWGVPRKTHEKTFYQNKKLVAVGSRNLLEMRDIVMGGGLLICMVDRPVSSRLELIPFLGRLALLDAAPFELAIKAKVPLQFSCGVKLARDEYLYLGSEIIETEGGLLLTLMNRYARFLEKVVREFPDQWFNFYPFWRGAATACAVRQVSLLEDLKPSEGTPWLSPIDPFDTGGRSCFEMH